MAADAPPQLSCWCKVAKQVNATALSLRSGCAAAASVSSAQNKGEASNACRVALAKHKLPGLAMPRAASRIAAWGTLLARRCSAASASAVGGVSSCAWVVGGAGGGSSGGAGILRSCEA